MECQFCKSPDVLYEVENPAIRLCAACRDKLGTHIAVYCDGCSTLWWLRKTPENIMRAADMSGLPPEHIADNYLVHEIKTCKRCYAAVKDFSVGQAWVQ